MVAVRGATGARRSSKVALNACFVLWCLSPADRCIQKKDVLIVLKSAELSLQTGSYKAIIDFDTAGAFTRTSSKYGRNYAVTVKSIELHSNVDAFTQSSV